METMRPLVLEHARPGPRVEVQAPQKGEAAERGSFNDVFADALRGVREAFAESEQASADALIGRGSPHTAILALTKADLSLRFVAQTRNKVVEAYREMMNLQV